MILPGAGNARHLLAGAAVCVAAPAVGLAGLRVGPAAAGVRSRGAPRGGVSRLGRRAARDRGRPPAAASVLLYALGVQIADAHGVTTDGVIYFAQLRSVIFDRDLDVAAEFAFLGQPPRPNHVVPIGPDAAVAAALPDRRGRRLRWARAVGAWPAPADAVGDRPRPALRPRGAAVVVRDRRRRAGGRCTRHLRREFSRPAWRSSPRCWSSPRRRSTGTWSTSRR